MENEFVDTITLIDDDGNELEFDVLDVIDTDDGSFYALLPNFETEEEALEQDTYFIFQSVEGENGEPELAEVEDDELLDQLAHIFEKRFEDMYDDLSDEEIEQ